MNYSFKIGPPQIQIYLPKVGNSHAKDMKQLSRVHYMLEVILTK